MLNKIMDWIVKKSRNEINKTDLVVSLAIGLAVSLVIGLAVSLAGGLAGGLVVSLAIGLAGGLAVSLAIGLAVSLVIGLAVSLVIGLGSVISLNLISTFKEINLEWFIIILIILTIGEILFWIFDRKQPKSRENKIIFTLKRKFINFLWAGLIFSQVAGGSINIKKTINYFNLNKELILIWIGKIGYYLIWVVLIVGIISLVIWLNSLKYQKEL